MGVNVGVGAEYVVVVDGVGDVAALDDDGSLLNTS